LNDGTFEIFIMFCHEKHPKGWNGVQLLGCSSAKRAVFAESGDWAYLGPPTTETTSHLPFLTWYTVTLAFFTSPLSSNST
ncbi:hypothetical protein DFP86_112145, partial [Paludibacterium purpuratum]